MSDIVIVENINVTELTVVDNNTSYDFSINEIVESIEFTVVEVFGKNGEQGIQGIQGEQGIQGIQGEKGEDGLNGIQSIQAGDNITIDNTDPLNPIINAEEGGTTVTKTSDLTNDGEDGTNPFITVLDIPTIDLSPYALLTDLAAEASTRLANDNAEITARQNADIAESNARIFADGVLDGKITSEKNRNDTQDGLISSNTSAIALKLDKPTTDGLFNIKKLGSSVTLESVIYSDFDSAVNQYFTNDLMIMRPNQFNQTTYFNWNWKSSSVFQAGQSRPSSTQGNSILYSSATTTLGRVHGNTLVFNTQNSFSIYRKFTIDTTISTQRIFVGFSANWTDPGVNPTNVAMSSLFWVLGYCMESGNPNILLIHNDSSGSATIVDTGFVHATKYIYEIFFSHSWGDTFINTKIRRYDTTNGNISEWTHIISSDFVNNNAHYPVIWCVDALNTATVKVKDYGVIQMNKLPYL